MTILQAVLALMDPIFITTKIQALQALQAPRVIFRNSMKNFIFAQRAIPALCLIILCSCSAPKCREWEIQENLTQVPTFNAGRLILTPDTNYSHLELELVRNSSGLRFYLNLLLMEAHPMREDPTRTKAEILSENDEPELIYPYLLEGGQRLMLPGDSADTLIQRLLEDNSFIIKIGRSQITVIPDNFSKTYEKLLSLPITMIVEKDCENLSFEP